MMEYLGIGVYALACLVIIGEKSKYFRTSHIAKSSIFTVAVCLYGLILYKNIDTPVGHDLNALNMVSMITWIISIVLLLASRIHPVDNLLLIVFPATIITMLLNKYSPLSDDIYKTITPSTTIHIFMALFSISILTITGLQAAIISIQNYLVKKNPLSKLLNYLPPLDRNQRIWVLFAYISFISLSLTLFNAFVYLENVQYVSNKLLFSAISWLVLFIILWKHYNTGYKSMRSGAWSILAFALLIWAYFGSKVFLG